MRCSCTLSSIMVVASWLLLTMMVAASMEGRLNVAALTLMEDYRQVHTSENEYSVTKQTDNRQSQNVQKREVAIDSGKVSYWKTNREYLKSYKSPADVLQSGGVDIPADTHVKRRSTVRTQPSLDSSSLHLQRHNHTGVPIWLRERIDQTFGPAQNKLEVNEIENEIAAVFRDVAYGIKDVPVKRKHSSPISNRYERTTALSETPDYNYFADESLPIMSGRRGVTSNHSDPVTSEETASAGATLLESEEPFAASGANPSSSRTAGIFSGNSSTAKPKLEESETVIPIGNVSESVLELEVYDDEMYNLYEEHDSSIYSDNISRAESLSDSLSENSSLESAHELFNNMTEGTDRLPVFQLSWFDYLLCTNRNAAWIFVNFLLGLILFGVSIFAPYRLLTIRSCTHILPRTHFVSVHLLVFVALSLKALYVFHLAFGGKERLPLVLILILTNTSIPCFISAYLVLIIMMFLTADVQVYKPKFLTMHNISIFIVMMIILSFVADIIVGSAHSKSVLLLSRIMLIGIAAVAIAFYIRKHSRVLQVAHMLKREFQGELKLLVVPSKDSPQQKQMDIKHILRNRLHDWCRVMKITTMAVGLCCLIHFIHAIFLICSHVPVWVWWSFHASGALAEAVVGVLFCIAAALTQRYDEKIGFIYSLLVPYLLSRKRKRVSSKEKNGNVVYQRVSYSSGTESTQYTSCPNEAVPNVNAVTSRTPKPPRRRTATVRRSATFSYAPQYPRAPGRPCQPPAPHLNVMRIGSASQIPTYNPGSVSHISDIYSPASISHVPVYSPASVRSMLVHEDGFVRIRTQVDPNVTNPRRSGSQIGIHEPRQYHLGSNPQIHNTTLQQWNGHGSRESFYHCLPRRRKSSRSSSFHQHNSQIPENDYNTEAPGGLRMEPVNVLQHHDQRTVDPNYQSFSRRRHRSRESSLKQLNNIERETDDYNVNRSRRSSPRGLNLQHMNNLDRPEGDYQSLGRRKLSYDDNNDPIYYNSSQEGIYPKFPPSRSNSQCSKVSPMNLSEKDAVSPLLPSPGSPSIRHKVSNISASPVRHVHSPSPIHTSPVGYSPSTSRREARYPKPYAHRGSSSSLKSEDLPYLEHYQRTNPVRRNHSSAGYFPSKYLHTPENSMMDDTQRYGSLRIGVVKKRPPGYVLNTNTSKLLNKYWEQYPKLPNGEDRIRVPTSEYGVPNKILKPREPSESGPSQTGTIEEGDDNECENSQSPANTSKGSEADWALELITSSSILTDFYSLKRPKKETKEKD